MEQDDYVGWLREESMLAAAGTMAGQFSGSGECSRTPSRTRIRGRAIEKASVWFTAYPDLDDHQARRVVSGYLG